MKKTGIFNSKISAFIASLGHKDIISVVDMGYPIPKGIEYADIVLDKGKPGFLETIEVLLKELAVEKVVIAEEMEHKNINNYNGVIKLFQGLEIVKIPHENFKEKAKMSKYFIRTGECTSFSNIMLISGVIF
ncbi:MAG TPA: D-ribose pyranase [Defluviitoga sp.]|nr:D-ribose pyranase [Candidatus Pacearchaeota archaeon]HQD62680.1 D-ribose pyranase [Defluviitoga sp.]